MSKVALVKCESYEYELVIAAVKKGLDLIGGPGQFVKTGEKLLLKPNLLSADPPEKCTTTHPSVFRAVAEVFKDLTEEISYGDSPAFHSPKSASTKAGIFAVADKLGIPLADFQSGDDIFFKEGVQNKKMTIAKGALACDAMISLPKLKTHGFEKMTGCIKNQFGCVPGPLKGEFHVKLPDSNDFARMLVDINSFLKPRLFVMDGIIAMEGNGPRGGTPKKMNVLLFSSDPVALDATVCRLVNLDPEFVPTTKFGMEAGLGTYIKEQIELLGDSFESFYTPDFDVKRDPLKPFTRQGGMMSFVKNSFVPRPKILSSKCVKCGICVNMCPVNPKAIDWHDGIKSNPPSYKYNRCIRCYCCQELCPESAIDLHVPPIRKLFSKKK
jgi:uncharacterized protein (DUF362 family)/Pyruvate/2-oxoacid:ferredoxin oxidoreductase delta subunit